MSCLLLIETAAVNCSVALVQENVIVSSVIVRDILRHDENLMPSIESVFTDAGLTYQELDGIAISAGPGSYTGLRIGISTAKGLCFALGIPLIAVSTLEILVAGFRNAHPDFKGLLCPMMDARRMEVYTANFSADGIRIAEDQPLILDADTWRIFPENQPVAFFGDGAAKCREILSVHPHAVFDRPAELYAENMGQIASEKWMKGKFEDLAYFEPAYLKPYQGTMKAAKNSL